MAYEPTDTVNKIIALLHNAEDLACRHQQRFLAADVVKACKIFSESRSFPVPDGIYDGLVAAVKGKMNGELTMLFAEIKKHIVAEDIRSQSNHAIDPEKASWISLSDKIMGRV